MRITTGVYALLWLLLCGCRACVKLCEPVQDIAHVRHNKVTTAVAQLRPENTAETHMQHS